MLVYLNSEVNLSQYRGHKKVNSKRFIGKGRAIEGNAAQQAAREKALSKKIEELFESGLSWGEAEEKAASWLKTQAALPNPDQIAGGIRCILGVWGIKG